MKNDLFDQFITETVEGFTTNDCRQSFVLSNLIIEKLKSKSLEEAIAIVNSFPKDLKRTTIRFLTDLYLDEILQSN